MDYIVNAERPDFIAITGDVIFAKPARQMLQSILDRLDSYKIPFCIVYGNHDAEQELSRPEMSSMIVSAKYSLNTLGDNGELADVKLPVASSVKGDPAPLDIYMLDSHDFYMIDAKVEEVARALGVLDLGLDKDVTEQDVEKITTGITLEDGDIKVDEFSFVKEGDFKTVGVEIHSGRNRIVRRMFEAVGYKVLRLDRTMFAGLTKKNLRRGDWRYLTEKEVIILKEGAFE